MERILKKLDQLLITDKGLTAKFQHILHFFKTAEVFMLPKSQQSYYSTS